MPEPVLISIAAALASRSVISLYKLVKDKFSDDPEATAVLEAAEGTAEDSAEMKKLRGKLTVAEVEDPAFSKCLHQEWERVRAGHDAQAGGARPAPVSRQSPPPAA